MNPPATQSASGERRPIAARDSNWARVIASSLARRGVTPNFISLFSIVCGAFAGAALIGTIFVAQPLWRCALYLLAIGGIQARLLCNLFDGMVAVEGGKTTKSGEVFNDFPDRVADPLAFIAAGYCAGGSAGVALGWAAALLAVLTAYVRVLGRALGAGTFFIGPMAKQHRMATMTLACAISAALCFWGRDRLPIFAALIVICIGCLLTLARRTRKIVGVLEHRS